MAPSASEPTTAAPSAHQVTRDIDSGDLYHREYFWRDHQEWLKERGYMLRPRFIPGWKPSWKGTRKDRIDCEDGQPLSYGQLIDATRISDGRIVALKKVSKSVHPHEIEIGQLFSSEPLRSNPHNHCIPVYEVLQVPGEDDLFLLVMPLLRRYNDPRLQTVGEVVAFLGQIFEGLQFLHENNVAHRDCMDLNIMMDARPLYPKMYHPHSRHLTLDHKRIAKHHTRTARPVRYYLTDFGLSRRYNPEDGPPMEDPIWGGDKTVPEFLRSHEPCDPFPTDIYYLGNLIREDFIQKFRYLDCLVPLMNDMVHNDPAQRPDINEVISRFDEIQSQLSTWQLRSRLVPAEEEPSTRRYRHLRHIFRTVRYILTFAPPIPVPRSRCPADSRGWLSRCGVRLRSLLHSR